MTRTIDDVHIVTLSGDLDARRSTKIRRALEEGCTKPHLVVDMSGVRSISPAVLTAFVDCYKERLSHGLAPAHLVVRSPHVRKVFEITDLAKLWPFFDSIEAASMA